LDFYSANSLKQQSAGKHVARRGHIILILVFFVTPQQIQSSLFLVLPDRASNQQSTTLETLHINTIDVVNTHLI